MDLRKRKNNNIKYDFDKNKRKKIADEIDSRKSSLTYLEDFSNELIYQIFDFLDIYDIYKAFLDLNHRFTNLIINSTFPIKVNISSLSKSNFQYYNSNIIQPNKHRIISFSLSNVLIIDQIFSSSNTISQFIRLKSLNLHNIRIDLLENLLIDPSTLSNLNSLILKSNDYCDYLNDLYLRLFHLPNLKSCTITLESCYDSELLPLATNEFSPIEYFIIEHNVAFDDFDSLLSYIPHLRYLSITYLDDTSPERNELRPIEIKNFTHLYLKSYIVYFDRFEKLIPYYFSQIQVLFLSVQHDTTYVDANRWERLILTYMKNLREFHLICSDYQNCDNQFTSTFWTTRQCTCTHHPNSYGNFTTEIFYSINNTSRKKNYQLYELQYTNHCSYQDKINYNSTNHLEICNLKALNNCMNYFANVTNLSFPYKLELINSSITSTLNRIIPLVRITKLVIKSDSFRFDRLIEILSVTPNLQILKLSCIPIIQLESDPEYLKTRQSELFKIISNRNRIKVVIIDSMCSFKKTKLLVTLCPQLEYLRIEIPRKQVNEIVEFLLTKTNNNTRKLFFLHITYISKLCVREVKRLIKSKKLLENYFIEDFDVSLYLWW